MFKRFFDPATIYMRRAQRSMDEARMAALEHESAAEHHAALARMYRERVARLQLEISPEQRLPQAAPIPQETSMGPESGAQVARITALKKREDTGGLKGAMLAQGLAG